MNSPFIKQKRDLIEGGRTPWHKRGRELLLDFLEAGLEAVDPYNAVKKHLSIRGNQLDVGSAKDSLKIDLNKINRVYVIGAGKATAGMAAALESTLGKRIQKGAINIPAHQLAQDPPALEIITTYGAGHPIPTAEGVEGAKVMVEISSDVGEKDLVFCLISGGGSALLPLPAGDLKLDDLQKTNMALLECGANIHEINTVRKHLSKIKGGWLAKHFHPSRMISLILSDVVGDDLSTIASGPTVPDPTTFLDAIEILKERGVFDNLPSNVISYLEDGKSGKELETPKPDDDAFKNVTNIVIGSAKMVASSIAKRVKKNIKDFAIHYVSGTLEGEAKNVGRAFSHLLYCIEKERERVEFQIPDTFLTGKGLDIEYNSDGRNTILVFTGETTVTIQGGGKGGRNQEMLLSLLLDRNDDVGVDFVMLSCGLDGIEGNSPAAGALVDNGSMEGAREKGLDPGHFLENNDSFTFFSAIDSAIVTGPTGTNVNDLTLVLVNKSIIKIELKDVSKD